MNYWRAITDPGDDPPTSNPIAPRLSECLAPAFNEAVFLSNSGITGTFVVPCFGNSGIGRQPDIRGPPWPHRSFRKQVHRASRPTYDFCRKPAENGPKSPSLKRPETFDSCKDVKSAGEWKTVMAMATALPTGNRKSVGSENDEVVETVLFLNKRYEAGYWCRLARKIEFTRCGR